MVKIYLSKKFFFITFMLSALAVNITFGQSNKGKSTNGKPSTSQSKTTTAAAKPANTKGIKARGIIAADMDCTVKVNGAAKAVNVKASTATVVILTYGMNTIDATSDSKTPAYYKTTVNVTDTSRQVIEISFYDDKKFLDYVKEGRADMVETAIKKNPGLVNNDDDILSSPPLQLAIVNSQPEVVKLLVNKGAKFNVPEYIYPLHKATVYASSEKEKGKDFAPDREIVDFLLTKGCKITEKDDGGNTLLHAACRGVKLDLVVYYLEQKGLDMNAKNDFGDTPLKIAEQKGAVSIINYLRSKGAAQDKAPDSLEDKEESSEQK